MYVDVPTNVSAIELMSSPETPKSQSLISPWELQRMLDGFMSGGNEISGVEKEYSTSVNYLMNIVEISQAFQDAPGNHCDDVDVDGTKFFVDAIEGTLIHELHADADIGVGNERAVEGDDVVRMAVVHDLELSEDLLPHGRLCVDQNNLGRGVGVFHRMSELCHLLS